MPRYKSRATRMGEECGRLEEVSSKITDIVDELRGLFSDVENTEDLKDGDEEKTTIKDIREEVDALIRQLEELPDEVEEARAEIESLSEEMGSWRDNMEGTNLEYTSKYEMVSEAADALEELASNCDEAKSSLEHGINELKGDVVSEDGLTFLEEAASELQNIMDEGTCIEFPGMY